MSAASHRAEARVVTAHASRYLQQLCKHFAHKLPETTFDPTKGRLPFPFGVCDLDTVATPDALALVLRLTADTAEDLERLQSVVASHLERFAFREELAVAWAPAN